MSLGRGWPRAWLQVTVGLSMFVQEAGALLPTWPGASSPPAPPRASVEGCFSTDLLSKWHLDSGLEALWGQTPHPTLCLKWPVSSRHPDLARAQLCHVSTPVSHGTPGTPALWAVVHVGEAHVKALTPNPSVFLSLRGPGEGLRQDLM